MRCVNAAGKGYEISESLRFDSRRAPLQIRFDTEIPHSISVPLRSGVIRRRNKKPWPLAFLQRRVYSVSITDRCLPLARPRNFQPAPRNTGAANRIPQSRMKPMTLGQKVCASRMPASAGMESGSTLRPETKSKAVSPDSNPTRKAAEASTEGPRREARNRPQAHPPHVPNQRRRRTPRGRKGGAGTSTWRQSRPPNYESRSFCRPWARLFAHDGFIVFHILVVGLVVSQAILYLSRWRT